MDRVDRQRYLSQMRDFTSFALISSLAALVMRKEQAIPPAGQRAFWGLGIVFLLLFLLSIVIRLGDWRKYAWPEKLQKLIRHDGVQHVVKFQWSWLFLSLIALYVAWRGVPSTIILVVSVLAAVWVVLLLIFMVFRLPTSGVVESVENVSWPVVWLVFLLGIFEVYTEVIGNTVDAPEYFHPLSNGLLILGLVVYVFGVLIAPLFPEKSVGMVCRASQVRRIIKRLQETLKSRLFALWISLWNAIGYLVSVAIPTFVDPQLEHATRGARTYPLGYWILLPALVVFVLTFVVNSGQRSAMRKGILTLLVLVIPTLATLPNFLPGFPHQNVLLCPLWFGLLTSLTTYVHDYQLRVDFLKNPDIDRLAKMERLKAEHDMWFRTLSGVFAAYVLSLAYIYIFLRQITVADTTDASEQSLLNSWFVVEMLLNVVLFLTGLIWQLVVKVGQTRGNLTLPVS